MNLKDRLKEYKIINKKSIPNFPKSMLIELTNVCNHSCIFCANSKMTRKKGFIDEKFLFHVLQEAFNEGTEEVGFYATGEPFMSKNLPSYIKKAKEIGYKYVYITTNGALATPERAREVIEAGVDSIKFSINAGNRETYKMVHGEDDFDIVIENLKFISNYRKEHNKNYKIFVSHIATKYSKDEKYELEKLIKDFVDDIVTFNVKNQGGLMYEINEHLAIDDNYYNSENLHCPLPFNSLHITYEGYLTSCCIDFQNYLTVADLNYISLKDAWNSKNFIELREKHLQNCLEGTLCYNCIYNKNENIEPLIPEHATYYDKSSFSKDEDIKNRLSNRV